MCRRSRRGVSRRDRDGHRRPPPELLGTDPAHAASNSANWSTTGRHGTGSSPIGYLSGNVETKLDACRTTEDPDGRYRPRTSLRWSGCSRQLEPDRDHRPARRTVDTAMTSNSSAEVLDAMSMSSTFHNSATGQPGCATAAAAASRCRPNGAPPGADASPCERRAQPTAPHRHRRHQTTVGGSATTPRPSPLRDKQEALTIEVLLDLGGEDPGPLNASQALTTSCLLDGAPDARRRPPHTSRSRADLHALPSPARRNGVSLTDGVSCGPRRRGGKTATMVIASWSSLTLGSASKPCGGGPEPHARTSSAVSGSSSTRPLASSSRPRRLSKATQGVRRPRRYG